MFKPMIGILLLFALSSPALAYDPLNCDHRFGAVKTQLDETQLIISASDYGRANLDDASNRTIGDHRQTSTDTIALHIKGSTRTEKKIKVELSQRPGVFVTVERQGSFIHVRSTAEDVDQAIKASLGSRFLHCL